MLGNITNAHQVSIMPVCRVTPGVALNVNMMVR
jgi:hypothetical protein